MRVDIRNLKIPKARGFIVIEGLNGAGKSTLQNSLKRYFEAIGRQAVLTREPGATELGRELRALLLEGKAGKISPRAELLLFAADRAEHVEKVIRPALAEGKVVISDRYFYSTSAFQGDGRGLDRSIIAALNELAIDSLLPDLVILLDIDPALGLSRNKSRSGDSFEQEELAFHQRIRAGFLKLADERPEPFVVIDGTRSAEQVAAEAQKALDRVFNEKAHG